jgi:hypothetical protein
VLSVAFAAAAKMFSRYNFSAMRVYAAVFALCTIAAILTSEPCCGSSEDQEATAVSWHGPAPAVGTEKNYTEATNKTEAAKTRPPQWCTALERPEWWVVIIAALTGFAIAYQAREMRRTTEAMGKQAALMAGQLEEMKKTREIETKTLTLQYRPRLVVRQARALEFNFELGEPGEGKIQFMVINVGGSPAHVTGGTVALWSSIGHEVGKIEICQGEDGLIQECTLQPGEDIRINATLLTGTVNDIKWANFHATATGLSSKPMLFISLVGMIRYVDDLGIPRRTGIHRGYDPKTQNFIRPTGENIDEDDYID